MTKLNIIPRFDAETEAAAKKVAEYAYGRKAMNVRLAILHLAHPDAPPGGRWRTILLANDDMLRVPWIRMLQSSVASMCVIVWLDLDGKAVLVSDLEGLAL
jgi:hypothetical protein